MYLTSSQIRKKVNDTQGLCFEIPILIYDEYRRCRLSYYEKLQRGLPSVE